MKLNTFLLIVSALIVFIVMPSIVSAHTLKINGSFGITTHIEPDDAPLAGQESKILIDIQDKSNRFNPYNPQSCNCVVEIQQNGRILKRLPFVIGNSFVQPRFVFPYGGTYRVLVRGEYNGQGTAFDSFIGSFDYYVDGQNKMADVSVNDNGLQKYLSITIIFAVVVVLLIIFLPAQLVPINRNEKNT